MSKTVKLLIEMPEKAYNRIKDKEEVTYAELFIANGTVITDDIISRDDLLEEIQDYIECNQNLSGIFETMKVIVKNAPTYGKEL